MSEILRTETLTKVRDGALAIELDNTLAEIYADCVSRPNLTKARSVILQIDVTPRPPEEDQVGLRRVEVSFKISKKTPPKQVSRPMRVRPQSKGFSFESDTDSIESAHGQQTLGD